MQGVTHYTFAPQRVGQRASPSGHPSTIEQHPPVPALVLQNRAKNGALLTSRLGEIAGSPKASQGFRPAQQLSEAKALASGLPVAASPLGTVAILALLRVGFSLLQATGLRPCALRLPVNQVDGALPISGNHSPGRSPGTPWPPSLARNAASGLPAPQGRDRRI